jgi:putative heme-binding domain-containing protein
VPRRAATVLLALICLWPSGPDSAAQPKKKGPPAPGKEPPATPAASLKLPKGFKAELLYSVPKDKEGSWVNLCVDPKGRLIVSDQYGGLYRVTPPPLGGKAEETKIEPIPLKVDGKVFGDAHGLLWAFDSLYVVVNSNRIPSGLYRCRDTDGDDVLDEVKLLHKLEGGQREHGPHAVILTPDKKNLVVVCGNQEPLVKYDKTRVPPHWGEDHLLPRMPDGRGFMSGVLGPGGAIYQVDPEGKTWELLSVGYRNEFDAAFNKDGDLFTFDADMEWDFNTPWYRPTRVCLVASGSDYGWRNGSGKHPPYYADTWPAIVDIGPGSPTGVCFGYGAKFPAKYRDAFFICDWSYGKLYAVHLTPHQSAYKADFEEFVSGTPLPLTDVVISSNDGAMYFTIGGRKTKSGLYRVSYTGNEPTEADDKIGVLDVAHTERRGLEAFHGKQDPKAIKEAWEYLSFDRDAEILGKRDDDRFLRAAARVAIESQDPKLWTEKALAETNPQAALEALLALVRVSADDPEHAKRKPADMTKRIDEKLKGRILDALAKLDYAKLNEFQKLELFRIYAILFVRMGPPDDATKQKLIERFDPFYPSKDRYQNAELCQLLVYLQAPNTAAKTLKLLAEAPTQEEQIEYAKSLRMLKAGWTPALREQYFKWFLKAANYKGGNSLEGFLANIKKDAVATLTPAEQAALKPILEAKPEPKTVFTGPPRPVYKQYKMDDLASLLDKGLTGRDFDNGRKMFGVANCFACHRFDNEGGAHGPDLTAAAGKFSGRDLLESILDPSKSVSDQYASWVFEMEDGKKHTGRIINLNGDTIIIMPNMLEPNTLVNLDARKIEAKEISKVSPMPTGLLDTLKEDEVLDLMAYLLSKGDRNSKMFKK